MKTKDYKNKVIRDSIHGDIKVDGIFLDLIASPELQRLYNIKQLGLAHLVFPGAHHTRLEHSLGTFYMAYRASEILNLDSYEKEVICCSSLLHDIGHGPFSHTLESLLRETLNVDHVDLTKEIIFGDYEIFDIGEKEYISTPGVYEILSKNEIDLKIIADTIKGENKKDLYLSKLLNSAIDVDQLDYLLRDAYYTGVAYGMIDVERFLQTLIVADGDLMVKRKGTSVVENILMARALMYSSIYFHKTVRTAELMLSKAIELCPKEKPFEFFKMTDSELISYLKKAGGFQRKIATCLKYRKLFKIAYKAAVHDLSDSEKKVIKKLDDPSLKKEKEKELEDTLNIPKGHVILDVPYAEIHLSEPRIDLTNISIFDKNQIRPLNDFTPVPEAIRLRGIPDWRVMIITDEKYRDLVEKNAEKVLFN